MSLRSLVTRHIYVCLGALVFTPAVGIAQTTKVETEFLMTLYAPLDAGLRIDSSLTIVNVSKGGWVKGPKITGELLAPQGDWFHTMPGGVGRLDVRDEIKTDDGALIYISYSGVLSSSKESSDRLQKGDVLTSKDLYFITAPTMQTSSEKYAWLNRVQCVGKMVEFKIGEGSFVKYDIYIVR